MKRTIQALAALMMTIAGCDCDGGGGFSYTYTDLRSIQLDILFVSESDGRQQVVAVADSNRDDIIGFSQIGNSTLDPTWHRDGRKLAYTNNELAYSDGTPFNCNIYIIDMDCLRVAPVTYSGYYRDTIGILHGTVNLRPDWHSLAQRITFISDRDSAVNIYIVRITDSLFGDTLPKRLTDPSDKIDAYSFPSFSPSGAQIVYTSKKTGSEEIWVMDTSGNNKTQLTNFGASICGRPRYSPTGDKILFYSNKASSGSDSLHIYTMDPNGTNVQQITTSGNNYDGAWTPDGQRIVFAKRTSSNKSYITVIGRDGTNETRWITGDSKAYYPIWRPQYP